MTMYYRFPAIGSENRDQQSNGLRTVTMTTNTQTYADICDRHPVYSAFDRECRLIGTIPIEFLRIEQHPFEAVEPATDCFALGIISSGSADLEVDFGEGLRRLRGARGAMYLNPTDGDTLCRQSTAIELLFISAPFATIAESLQVDSAELKRALRPLHDKSVVDASLASWSFRLWDLTARPSHYDGLAIDHGLLALVTALMAKARPDESLDQASKRLDNAVLARIGGYAADHLDGAVSLADLAALTGLSRWGFSRAFKATTGQTPHEFITDMRLARARDLLSAGTESLADVAYACGFSSQSHMTDVFRQKLGTTPGRYRREVKG